MLERRRDVQQRQPEQCLCQQLVSLMKKIISRAIGLDEIRQGHQSEPADGKVAGR